MTIDGSAVPKGSEQVGTFLPPVTQPRSIALRAAYALMRRQFGKVMTPLAVFNARMPLSFLLFYGKVSRLDKKLVLPPKTANLVREQVASITGCHFCMDAARYYAMRKTPEEAERLDALHSYRTSPLFTDAERAALDYASELTREHAVRPETITALSRQFGEREICELVWLVASEHLYNLTNIGLNIGSDGLCELPRRR